MKKIGRLLLWAALVTNQLAFVPAILAQDATITPADTPVVTSSAPTSAPDPTSAPAPTNPPAPTSTPADTPTPTTPTDTPTETPSITPSETTPTIDPTETPTISPDPTATPVLEMVPASASNSPSTVVIVVNNSAQVSNNTQSSANSGGNQTSNPAGSQSTITTGKTVALANLVNIANTNNVDSQVKVYLLNNLTGSVDQIDLNAAWNLLASGQSDANVLTVDQTGQNNNITLDNFGTINNQVTATADSGNNQISGGGNNTIQTGDAYALVNIVNLLNTNFIGSKVFLGVINLDGSSLGDLILPNPSNFAESTSGGSVSGSINNEASITSQVLATADSGNNQTTGSGDSLITTGDAQALAKVLTMANINLVGSNQLMLSLNTLGNWTGKIYNWGSPGSVTDGSSNNFFITEALTNGGGGDNLAVDINNQASIQNVVLASANTGGNTIDSTGGDNSITTGQAWSSASVTNLANLNFINSNWFYGIINVVGDWNGNAIFAYPDLDLSLAVSKDKVVKGDELDISVNYGNIGYDGDPDAKINLTLPAGLEYEGDNSGMTSNQSGSLLTWSVGQISSKSNGSFVVRTKLVNDQEAKGGFHLIPQALAADNSWEIVVNGMISTSKAEVTTDNNSASVGAEVELNGTSNTDNNSNSSPTTLWPKLSIGAKNNVNNFVYKGDVVTFEINGTNEGEATAYRSFMRHRVYNSKGTLVSENTVYIGDVGIQKSGRVTFGVPINFAADNNEKFTSETEWIGYTQNNEEVDSNIAETSFMVKTNQTFNIPLAQTVQAAGNGKVLGFSTEVCQPIIDLLPYILLFVVSGFWLLKQTARWLEKKQ